MVPTQAQSPTSHHPCETLFSSEAGQAGIHWVVGKTLDPWLMGKALDPRFRGMTALEFAGMTALE
jgi:hypothetical protein